MNDLSALPEAGPLRRVLALVYDTLMVTAITLSYVLLMTVAVKIVTSPQPDEMILAYQYSWFPFGMVAVNICFFIYFWHKAGQTIGMRAWRLKLVDLQGQPPSIQQCFLRCLLAPISIALFGMGYWWCWIDKDGRCAHDRFTNTRVMVLPKAKKK